MATDTDTTKPLIAGLAHINLTIPPGTLPLAHSFYGTTLLLTARPVPAAQTHELAWFDIISPSSSSTTTPVQQIHISIQKHDQDAAHPRSSRHPCFHLPSREALEALRRRILDRMEAGGEGAPMACDGVGESSGPSGEEYPTRFFARDYAGNRLEFSL